MTIAFHVLRFGALALVTVAVLFVAGVFAFVPGERHAASALPTVSDEETARTLAALKPPKRARPVIAVIGANEGTETTDFLVPYGVLKRAGVADVFAVATLAGPISMKPALTIMPDLTAAEFTQRFADGADYVIVPALHDPGDAAAHAFIKAQQASGATIVSICNGTLVLADAGLLDGRNATGHWWSIGEVVKEHPTMRWVRDRRFVVDRGVLTATGISSSVPVSLTLIEAIAGRERATAIAQEIGARGWQATHDSSAFRLIRDDVWMILGNLAVSVLAKETVGIHADDGADVVALAFTADTYSRTFRSQAVVLGTAPVRTGSGLLVLPDAQTAEVTVDLTSVMPVQALETAIKGIEARYGHATAAFVRVQLEDAGHTAGS